MTRSRPVPTSKSAPSRGRRESLKEAGPLEESMECMVDSDRFHTVAEKIELD